jgi:hypothetical protein
MLGKLGLGDRTQAVVTAYESGLVTPHVREQKLRARQCLPHAVLGVKMTVTRLKPSDLMKPFSIFLVLASACAISVLC